MKISVKKLFFLLVFLSVSILSVSCSMRDINEFTDAFRAEDDTLEDMADPGVAVDYETELEKQRIFYDEKSGKFVNEVQYKAYTFTDAFKKYGIYVTLPCLCVGFLIRRIVKNSASIRKLGLVLEIVIPTIYLILAYVISAVADAI